MTARHPSPRLLPRLPGSPNLTTPGRAAPAPPDGPGPPASPPPPSPPDARRPPSSPPPPPLDAPGPPSSPPPLPDVSGPPPPPFPPDAPGPPASPPHSDPSRTGATWVTGTGALLLFAAAAVFVAVRWAEIPASAKLAAVAALTGAFLLAGRRLRSELPATAGALFHLGAFLVPVDIAAVAVRAELDWSHLLLLEGLVCSVAFALGARSERSVVLRWAATASVVVAAAGVGATTSLPAPLVVAAAAAAALLLGRSAEAVPLSLVAGLSPVAGFALTTSGLAPGVLERLGLAGGQPRLVGLLAGVATAAVLGSVARRRVDPGLADLALACAVSGALVSGMELEPTVWAGVVGCCALIAILEAGALVARDDPFWAGPTDRLAIVAEALAVPGSLAAAFVLASSTTVVHESSHGAVAVGLLAATWAMADLRRRVGRGTPLHLTLLLGGRYSPATFGMAACAPAAVLLATGSGPASALALTTTAALLVVGGRPRSAWVAVALTTLAPLAALGVRSSGTSAGTAAPDVTSLPVLCAAIVTLFGGVLLARVVCWHTALDEEQGRTHPATTWCLAAAALLPVGVGVRVLGSVTDEHGSVLLLAAASVWLVALAADTAGPAPTGVPLVGSSRSPSTSRRAGGALGPADAIRLVGTASVLGACGGVEQLQALAVAALVAVLIVVDAVRRDEPGLAYGLMAALPVLTAAAGASAGLTDPGTGLAMTITAVGVAAVACVLPVRWRLPVSAGAATLAALGLVLATGERTAAAHALVVIGGSTVAAGVLTRRSALSIAGGVAITIGAWSHLAGAGVSVSEPYLVPVAVLLLLCGWRSRSAATSWVTTGPAIALLGGAALVERLAGGGGGHALVAGLVGVAAVVVGGTWRLAAPLLLGSSLLALLAVHESLAVTAGVPTWAWLALGGSTLLGAGIALERAELGPIESGRRLVDVVQQHFG